SFKESLMLRRSGEGQEREFATMDYSNPTGSTVTGMGDSFQQFGYSGCLFFVALAIVFRSIWQVALQPNALFAQLLYMQSCTSAMRAVTHWTLDFLPGFLYSMIFLGAAMFYAGGGAPRKGTGYRKSGHWSKPARLSIGRGRSPSPNLPAKPAHTRAFRSWK